MVPVRPNHLTSYAYSFRMNLIRITSIAILSGLSVPVVAEGLQSYEAGSYSIRARIEELHKITSAIEARLEEPALPAKEKELRLACLEQYASEKAKLQDDLESGRKVSESIFVTYLAQKSDQECTAGLSIPSLVQP
jgi:hypothetical protein